MGKTYDIGDLPRLRGRWTAPADGSPIDPTTVTFRMKLPNGNVTTFVYNTDNEVVRESAGVYYVDWPCAVDGTHAWRFDSTGAGQAAAEDSFVVRPSRVL